MLNKGLFIVIIFIVISGCSDNIKKINPISLKEIRFLELNSDLASVPKYTDNFNNGVNLAVAEINARGGIKGRPIVIINKDAQESYLTSREIIYKAKNTDILAAFGTYFTDEAKGASKSAGEYKIPFLSSAYTDDIIYKYPNNYTYSLRPGLQSLLHAMAIKAKSIGNLNRWLIISYSNSEGTYVSDLFKQEVLKANNIKIEKKRSWIFRWFDSKKIYNNKERYLFLNHYIAPFKPTESLNLDKTFNSDLSLVKAVLIVVNGTDLQQLIDNSNLKSRLLGKQVFVLFAGEPEWFSYTSNQKTPENWITSGYPWYNIKSQFNSDYWSIYHLEPRYSSVLGYISIYMLAEAAQKIDFNSGNLFDIREQLNQQLSVVKLKNSPLGGMYMRPDHKASLGAYIGNLFIYSEKLEDPIYKKVLLKDVRMKNIEYFPASNIAIPVEQAIKIRQYNKNNTK